MMENFIREELKKNSVKDNMSGKFDKLSYKFHKGISKHFIKSSLIGSYGYIYVTIGSAENFNLYFNGLPIFNIESGYSSLISLKFTSGDYIEIEGDADCVTIQIYGAEFENKRRDKILYNSNIYLEDCGGMFIEYNYQTFLDGKKLFDYMGIVDAVDVVEFKYNSNTQIAKIMKDDKLYLCTNIDNYTTKYLCDFDYDDVVLLPGFGSYLFGVAYIESGKIYISGFTRDFKIESPICVETVEAVKGINYIVSNNMAAVFSAEYCNGNTGIYFYNGSGFIEILNIKSRKENICILDSEMYIDYKDGYDEIIKKYTFNNTMGKVSPVFQKRIILADNIMICDNTIMITYNFMERFVYIEDL